MLEHGIDVSRELVRRRRDRPFEPQSAVPTPKRSPHAECERCSDRAASRSAIATRFFPFRTRRDFRLRLLS